MESLLIILSRVRFDIIVPFMLIILAVSVAIIVIYVRHTLIAATGLKQAKSKKDLKEQDQSKDILQILDLEFTEIRMD